MALVAYKVIFLFSFPLFSIFIFVFPYLRGPCGHQSDYLAVYWEGLNSERFLVRNELNKQPGSY